MLEPRSVSLSLLGVLACSSVTAKTILNIIDAITLSTMQSSLTGLASTASVLDGVAVAAVVVFSTQYAWTRDGIIKKSGAGKKIFSVCCVFLSTGALVVSLALIVTLRSRLDELEQKPTNQGMPNLHKVSSAQIAIWVLACVSQIGLFSSAFLIKPPRKVQPVIISGPRDSVMSEIRHSNPTANFYLMEPTQPSSPLAALPSPTFSTRSSQSLRSWRESLHQAVRPVTSRTKLINRPSFIRDARSVYSDSHSIGSVSQTDGFDAWEVDQQSKEAVIQLASAPTLARSRGTMLEPIPGSRPASPAWALDGPFPDVPPEGEIDELPPPPKMVLDISRPPSPAVSEAHIHPLFRSESPTPPPAATPGTNILASPLSNQVITCPPRPYSRMRSNSSRSDSRGASPNPLVQSRSFLHERAMTPNSQRASSRSPSPPGREMTPPIPDFVLNPSSRSSMSGSRR